MLVPELETFMEHKVMQVLETIWSMWKLGKLSSHRWETVGHQDQVTWLRCDGYAHGICLLLVWEKKGGDKL